MENEFVTYEIAKLLKELNFDEPCLAWYYFNEENSSYALNSFKQDYGDKFDWWKYSELDSDVYVDHLIAPLWQQVIDWLREKYDLHIDNGWCISDPFGNSQCGYDISVYNKIKDEFIVRDFNLDYYKAREISILKAIDTIKQV